MSDPRSGRDGGDDRTLLRADGDPSPWADRDPRRMELWFPRFFLMEVVALLVVFSTLALFSLVVDAPLLELADSRATPDPSKAPWYFAGLQELLHYYPPVVAGAVVPAAVVVALVALPYIGHPSSPTWRPLWDGRETRSGQLMRIGAVLAGTQLLFLLPAAHVPWVLHGPSTAVAVLMAAPGLVTRRGVVTAWLAARTLLGWVATWMLVTVAMLTLVGTLFRGPGWSWTWPWVHGVF